MKTCNLKYNAEAKIKKTYHKFTWKIGNTKYFTIKGRCNPCEGYLYVRNYISTNQMELLTHT